MNGMDATLSAAAKSLAKGHTKAAEGQLRAFFQQLEAPRMPE